MGSPRGVPGQVSWAVGVAEATRTTVISKDDTSRLVRMLGPVHARMGLIDSVFNR